MTPTRHKDENRLTRLKYIDDIKNIMIGVMVIVLDYKQNLIVGHTHNEEHWRFRQLSQRTCLNITVITKKHLYRFDIISEISS